MEGGTPSMRLSKHVADVCAPTHTKRRSRSNARKSTNLHGSQRGSSRASRRDAHTDTCIQTWHAGGRDREPSRDSSHAASHTERSLSDSEGRLRAGIGSSKSNCDELFAAPRLRYRRRRHQGLNLQAGANCDSVTGKGHGRRLEHAKQLRQSSAVRERASDALRWLH